jgi:phosphoglycerate dehydrogenase-like enzyme/predicted dehydrogenase
MIAIDSALRVLVIGAGPASAALHLPALARLRDRGRITLDHVVDLDSGRAAAACREFGFREHSGMAEAALERKDFDAVYILGSAQMHYHYGLLTLRSGKHLFVEKPIAASYVQALELAQTARDHGLIAVGGLNRRFQRALAAVRARAGRAGWRLAEAVFHKPELAKPPPFGARTWLTANGIHALDALVFMMGGLPDELFAQAAGDDATAPSTFSALMRWRDGRQGVFLSNNAAGTRREEYVFHAPGETCSVTEAGLVVESAGTQVKTPLATLGDGIDAEHDAFLLAIQSGESPVHSLHAIAPSLYLAELIESGFCGPVPLPRIDTPRPGTARSRSHAILVDQPAGLPSALAQHLQRFRLVSRDDIERSATSRSDVVGAILGRGAAPLTENVLAKLPQLSVVGIVALSVARYQPEQLLACGITLINASGAYADSVAEFAFGLAILARRRAFMSHQIMRAGGWGSDWRRNGWQRAARAAARRARPLLRRLGLEPLARKLWSAARPAGSNLARHPPTPRLLRGASAGLIGWSANAQALCERLIAAGVTVWVFSEHASPAAIRAAGASPVALEEALAADIVSLHRGLTPQTYHFLGAPELARLRPGAVLINIARGALIEPGALLARLKPGDITACLDTFETEPAPAAAPLRRLANVFLTSHIAGGSADMHAAAGEEVVRKVAAFLSGEAVDEGSVERLATMS